MLNMERIARHADYLAFEVYSGYNAQGDQKFWWKQGSFNPGTTTYASEAETHTAIDAIYTSRAAYNAGWPHTKITFNP